MSEETTAPQPAAGTLAERIRKIERMPPDHVHTQCWWHGFRVGIEAAARLAEEAEPAKLEEQDAEVEQAFNEVARRTQTVTTLGQVVPLEQPAAGSGEAEQRLREIRERAAKVTPGPWYAENGEMDGFPESWDVMGSDHCGIAGVVGTAQVAKFPRDKETNAEFIAHARDDVPWLCREYARLTAALAEAREEGERAKLATEYADAVLEWEREQEALLDVPLGVGKVDDVIAAAWAASGRVNSTLAAYRAAARPAKEGQP